MSKNYIKYFIYIITFIILILTCYFLINFILKDNSKDEVNKTTLVTSTTSVISSLSTVSTNVTSTTTSEVKYVFYSEKEFYSLKDTQFKFVIMREDGEEFTYSDRHKLYIKENGEWVLIPTVDKSNTFKPIAYRAIKNENNNIAKGIIYVYLNKFEFDFKFGEYKVELISFGNTLTSYFEIK